MKDSFEKDLDSMNISVTSENNYNYKYNLDKETSDIGKSDILSIEEIEKIVQAAVKLGFSKFNLTGGEPLLRKELAKLIKKMTEIEGVEEVNLFTNGALLTDQAKDLKEAGLNKVYVSFDSMRNNRFREITGGGDMDDVIAGINAATGANLKPVGINVMVMKDFNDDEILDYIQLTFQHEVSISFIEFMPIGNYAGATQDAYVSNDEIKAKLPALRKVEAEGQAVEVFKYPGARGIIRFMNKSLYEQTTKIELTPAGLIKVNSNQGVDLRTALQADQEEVLLETLKNAVLQ